MKIAVTGYKGRLGSWLAGQCGFEPLECDITNRDSVTEAIAKVEPQVIVNCAAWSVVDSAEENKDEALLINTRGPGILRTEHIGLMVHISTPFVFNGKKGPYKEDDYREPVQWYGWTKFGGEEASLMREPTLVIRVSDLYGVGPLSDFVRRTRDKLELGVECDYPTNYYKTPTYIPHLCEGIVAAIEEGITGFLHIAGEKTMSTYDWGKMIANAFHLDDNLIVPGNTYGTAVRPLRGGLDVSKARILGIPLYSPGQGLEALMWWESEHGE